MHCDRVNTESLAATRAVWEQQIDSLPGEVAPSMYEGVLAFADKCTNGAADRGMHAYGLFREGEAHACAILQVSYVQIPGDSWLKVLEITVEPRLDVSETGDGSGASLRELAHMASSAIVESLGLTYETHPCGKVKIFGRSPLTVEFLQAIYSSVEAGLEAQGLKVGREGNWFVINKSQNKTPN